LKHNGNTRRRIHTVQARLAAALHPAQPQGQRHRRKYERKHSGMDAENQNGIGSDIQV
jgi:hypothetical protein